MDVVLKLAGHKPFMVKSAEDALKMLKKGEVTPDLIITNHNMTGMNGVAFVRNLKQTGFTGEIVVLTGYADSKEVRKYRDLGVVGIMGKPFNVIDLRQWMDCIKDPRDPSSSDQGLPCPLKSKGICWLNCGVSQVQ